LRKTTRGFNANSKLKTQNQDHHQEPLNGAVKLRRVSAIHYSRLSAGSWKLTIGISHGNCTFGQWDNFWMGNAPKAQKDDSLG
jgi:hypothetical protein